jgi:glycosyltransferase involved in cell wall biosynthesis
MRILVISGIWPPDVGGPATHAPEAAAELSRRGHDVVVLTTAARPPSERPFPVRWVPRSLPPGARHAAVGALVARLSSRADVIYATSMIGRSAFAARAPLVVKIAGDPAYERSLRRDLYSGTLAEFQSASLGRRASALRRWRTLTARRAAHLLCPSEFLRSIVVGWGIPSERVGLLPNPIPSIPHLRSREELRASFAVGAGPLVVFAGRLTRAKDLGVLLAAMERLEDATLLVAGDGELRAELETRASARIRFLGALPRDRVLELFAAADVAALSSAWENFPHTLVEALAVGTPVVATRVGGVPEIVDDGENGVLVPPGDAAAFADALRRCLGDERLRANAAPSVSRFSPQLVFDELEAILLRTVAP